MLRVGSINVVQLWNESFSGHILSLAPFDPLYVELPLAGLCPMQV
jgi:hypothetical protein